MSILKVATIQNSAGTEIYTAKGWINFNGVGTIAVRASGNFSSSVTDGGTGIYTINFTTAMIDTNYSPMLTTGSQITGGTWANIVPFAINLATTSLLIYCSYPPNGVLYDQQFVGAAIFR